MPTDLVIRNGRVVTPDGVVPGGLAIAGETIVAVDADAKLPPARRIIDARGQYILPGLIDAYVHMASEEDPSIVRWSPVPTPTSCSWTPTARPSSTRGSIIACVK